MEQSWFGKITTTMPIAARPALANCEIQFFSIEDIPGKTPSKGPQFTIVAVGINYGQQKLPTSPASWIPHRFNANKNNSWVEDYQSPQTRRVLDIALDQFYLDPTVWKNNNYASAGGGVHSLSDLRAEVEAIGCTATESDLASIIPHKSYVLICTNISPFLSQQMWSQHTSVQQQGALKVWDPNQHLCDLINRLGADVDLWIIHGRTYVWPTFDPTVNTFRKWLLIPNLNPLCRRRMKTFWKVPRQIHTPRAPQWPHCTVGIENVLDVQE